MRFCMVTTFYPPYHFGGDATYVRALSRALVKQGHEVEVIHCEDAYRTVSHHKQDLNDVNDDGIVVHRLKSRFGILSSLYTQQTGFPGFKKSQLKKILKKNFDVVHFHNISLVGGPAVLKLSTAPVTLYTLHEHWLLCSTHIFWKNKIKACDKRECFKCSLRSGIPPQLWRYTNLITHSLRSVDTLIAPSLYTLNKHRDAGIKNNIQVLPLFSSLMVDKDNIADFNDVQEYQKKPFVYAGRVTRSKGIIQLFDVFSTLPNISLQIIGDGDLLEELKQTYSDNVNIQFLGKLNQENLVQHYLNAKALILPSLAPETFGLTIVEAFACGTPAIVRYSGGSRDIIDNTGGGFVYNNDDELLSNIIKLNSNISLRNELGHKARAGYESLYTEEKHIDDYMDIISCIASQK